jgi:hypothetical protein
MALEALGLIALGIMLGTGGYVFLTSGWESAALGKRPGEEPKGPSAAYTHNTDGSHCHDGSGF